MTDASRGVGMQYYLQSTKDPVMYIQVNLLGMARASDATKPKELSSPSRGTIPQISV